MQPDGSGPFPAVVVLHGCGGISSHSIGIADELSRWGYVALAVDSVGSRDMRDVCGQFFIGQVTDALAAAGYLAQQPVVDATRIAILGQSMGASSVLTLVERGSTAGHSPQKFVAAIAYYPACRGHSPIMDAPTLILIGADDDLNRADACRDLASLPHAGGADIELVVYPGTYHAFDVDWFQPGTNVRGHWFEYNASAANDARSRVRDFLDRNLRR